MQAQNVRTTIVVPRDLLEEVKRKAFNKKKTISAIFVDAVTKEFPQVNIPTFDPREMLGKFKLHIKKGETFRREDMYADYLKHKVPS
jgi:hypothetical protein